MDDLHHLMTVTDSFARVDLLTNLGIPAVAARGWSSLTPAVIAEGAGCSRQAVHQWFGPGTAMRTAFAQRFTARWSRWAEIRVHRHGPGGLLPSSPDALGWVRVWVALREQATRDATLTELVDFYHEAEGEALARRLGTPPTTTVALQVLLDGLRLRLAVPEGDDADEGEARSTLAEVLTRLLDVKQAGGDALPSP